MGHQDTLKGMKRLLPEKDLFYYSCGGSVRAEKNEPLPAKKSGKGGKIRVTCTADGVEFEVDGEKHVVKAALSKQFVFFVVVEGAGDDVRIEQAEVGPFS